MHAFEHLLIRLTVGILIVIISYTVGGTDAAWACTFTYAIGSAISEIKNEGWL